MAERIFLKASNPENWSKSVHHFRSSQYFVEIGEKYSTLAVSVPEAHKFAAMKIIKDFGLDIITGTQFQSSIVARAKSQPTTPTPPQVVKSEQVQPLPPQPVQVQPVVVQPVVVGVPLQIRNAPVPPPDDVCVCGWKSGRLRFHRPSCYFWAQYVEYHTQDIIKDFLAGPRIYHSTTLKWHIARETLYKLLLKSGRITEDKLPPSIKALFTKRGILGAATQVSAQVSPLRTSQHIGIPLSGTPRPTDEQIVAGMVANIQGLIARHNALEVENKRLYNENKNMVTELALLRAKMAQFKKLL